MSKSARRLGRGLNSLVSDLTHEQQPAPAASPQSAAPSPAPASKPAVQAAMVEIDELIANPFQPRSMIDSASIDSLAHSIRHSGILQPITVRKAGNRFEIIAGERRWAAAREAGLATVPVIVRQATDDQMLELALIENIQREDLNAIDRAMAYRQFCTQFDLKPDEVAKRLGEDRTTVVNYIRLLDLPDEIRQLVANEQLSMGHARCILAVSDTEHQLTLARSAAGNQLSVRALEELVRREKTRPEDAGAKAPPGRPARAAHLSDLEHRFEQAAKTKVTIREGKKKGSGRLIIEYYSFDDFDRIATALGVDLDD